MGTEELFLSLLGSEKGYVTEKHLAKKAGISRSAATKLVKSLQRYGYNISSKHGGYRLAAKTDLPLPWELTKVLDTLFIGKRRIVYRHRTHSTQDIAVHLAEENSASHGMVVIAEQQKNGRGRQERKWLSPKGGIWLSVVLKPRIHAEEIIMLPFAAALAVHDAIKKCTYLDTKLRWPNDVTIFGKKVAGILIDVSIEEQYINYAVIGVGINVNVDSSAINSCLEDGVTVTSISDELGRNTSILDLTRELLERVEYYYLEVERCGPTTIIEKWKKNSDTLGRKVAVAQNNKTIQGIVAEISDDGSLLVRTGRHDTIVMADDVRVIY